MKNNKKNYQWLILLIVLLVAILASSCGLNSTQPEITSKTDTIEYPYTWDSIKYSRIISHINDSTSSIEFDITVKFNEEFIEIINNEFPNEEPIIFIGGWVDKATFRITGIGHITINHRTCFMTINYDNGAMKEIYTN